MALSDLPADAREEIAALVALPSPPPKWIVFEFGALPSRAWSEWFLQRGLRPNRGPLNSALRAAVIERDGLVCHLCGGDVVGLLHIDHVIPRSKGGPDTLENLRVTHPICNMRKGNRA